MGGPGPFWTWLGDSRVKTMPNEKTRRSPDPLIDEVRAIRRAISEESGNDVRRLCDRLQELERQHPEWTLVPEPKTPPSRS
jgi:hypothetical protein